MDIADFMYRGAQDGLGDLGDLGIAWRAVNHVINQAFPQLYDMVEPALLPREAPNPRGRIRHFEHYGCGLYGCVLPTGTDRVVFKITTDPSEIVYLEQINDRQEFPRGAPEGVVRFMFYTPFPPGVTYKRQPVYAVWREEVDRPGGLADDFNDLPDAVFLAANRLMDTKDCWTRAYNICAQLPNSAKFRFMAHVSQLRPQIESDVAGLDLTEPLNMRNRMGPLLEHVDRMELDYQTAFLIEFGRRSIDIGVRESAALKYAKQALWSMANNELYLCDVHLGNLGLADRHGRQEWVVSDVGQCLPWKHPGLWVAPPRIPAKKK